ncbi:MAG: hypothetical protein M1570_04485 [Chloroflexi bacterium]|nr:hypothetical protein [Chloroflexota bacterium]
MSPRKGLYKAFLVRLWWVGERKEGVCRASIEDAETHERTGFAGVEGMFAFLSQQAEGMARSEEGDGQTQPDAEGSDGGEVKGNRRDD